MKIQKWQIWMKIFEPDINNILLEEIIMMNALWPSLIKIPIIIIYFLTMPNRVSQHIFILKILNIYREMRCIIIQTKHANNFNKLANK